MTSEMKPVRAGDGTPAVSVVLPVHNGAPYIAMALESLLGQTFGDFELIVIDDGSTDHSSDTVRAFRDPRIRLYEQAKQGVARTLNRGIELARGEFIARQDHDDISLPERLSAQYAYLRKHPDCAILGTWATIVDAEGKPTGREHLHPTQEYLLKWALLLNNPLVHSSVMMRKTAVQAVGGYCELATRQPPEDFELWSRMARSYRLANLPERLVLYREVPTSISRDRSNPFLPKLIQIAAENLAYASGDMARVADALPLTRFAHDPQAPAPTAGELRTLREMLANAVKNITSNPKEQAELSQYADALLRNAESMRMRRWVFRRMTSVRNLWAACCSRRTGAR